MRKRWTDRFGSAASASAEESLEDIPLELLQTPLAADHGDFEFVETDSLGAFSLPAETEIGNSIPLGASAKPKPAKMPKFDIVDASREPSSGSAATTTVPKFDIRTFNHAKLHSSTAAKFTFPWERGIMKRIFSTDDQEPRIGSLLSVSGTNSFKVQMSVDEEAKVSAALCEARQRVDYKSIYASVVKTAADIGYQEERQKKRCLAVSNWWKLLSVDLSATEVGKKVADEADVGEIDEYGKELLDACFGVKSPNTLLKRYYSVNSFSQWCLAEHGCSWVPIDEKLVWLYIRHLKCTQAPPTKPASFLEAVRFCWFVLGVEGGQEVMGSFRVKGLSAQMFSQKKEWQPADILTVDEVKKLHAFMECDTHHLIDRVVSGHLLHMLYVRARWSDLLAVKNAFIDGEGIYFELVTRAHKGAKGADAKAKLLPLVAPCDGVTGNWTSQYLQLRAQAGLKLPSDFEAPMLPAPTANGEIDWSQRPMTSEEGSEFLRRILGIEKSPERRISSHSLKSTSMSWTSKFGLNFESRALLARHISSVSNPTAVYSRDLLSPVLRAFREVVCKIGGRVFEPDKTRSGMLTPAKEDKAPCTPWMSEMFTAEGVGDKVEDVLASDDELPVLDATKDIIEATGGDSARVTSDTEMSALGFKRTLALFGNESEAGEADNDWEELSESSESECSYSSSSSEEGRIVKSHPIFEQIPIESGQHYVNNKSAVLHCVTGKDVFRCGRKVTSSYTLVKDLNGIRCSRCYNL